MNLPTIPNDLLDRKEAANYLRSIRSSVRTANSLAQLAVTGGGPPFFVDGGRVLYSKAELDEWRASRLTRRNPKA